MSRKKIVLIAILVLSVCTLAAVLFAIGESSKNNTSPTKQEVVEEGSIEDRLANIPKDAQSDVCDSLKADKMKSVTGLEITSARPSIKTTKTQEGSVSACTYLVSATKVTTISYIVVTTRKFTQQADLDKAFTVLATGKNKKTKQLDPQTLYNEQQAQLIKAHDSHLTTAIVSRTNAGKSLENGLVKALVSVL